MVQDAGLSTLSGDNIMPLSGAHPNFRPFGHEPLPANWLKKETFLAGLSNSSASLLESKRKRVLAHPSWSLFLSLNLAQRAKVKGTFYKQIVPKKVPLP
jgi:hypothetical protein